MIGEGGLGGRMGRVGRKDGLMGICIKGNIWWRGDVVFELVVLLCLW